MRQYPPMPANAIPLGKNQEEHKALSLASLFVIERAMHEFANHLTARRELDHRDRLVLLERFVGGLSEAATNARLDGFDKPDEEGGKQVLVGFITRMADKAQAKLMRAA
jgi:hypothetical protein